MGAKDVRKPDELPEAEYQRNHMPLKKMKAWFQDPH